MSPSCRYRPGLRHWHPLLLSRELGARPVARRLAGQAIVLFRTASGRVGAVAEACSHRRLSLAVGRVQGEDLVCAYHGWRFDPEGAIRCPLMPGHRQKPQAFQVGEAPGLIWVRAAIARGSRDCLSRARTMSACGSCPRTTSCVGARTT